MRTIALLPILLSCSEYNLAGDEQVVPGSDSEPPPQDSEPIETDTGDSGPQEVCDGLDNDGDGEVDEGFLDFDEDGVADCVDDSCSAQEADPSSEIDKACEGGENIGTPPKNPWNWTIEWQWNGGQVYSTPTVGDLDLDGVPEVVVNVNNTLHVFDGASGNVEFTAGSGIDAQSGTALGDIDGDGYGDIVTSTGSCYSDHNAQAFDKAGQQLWSTNIGSVCETYPVIQDLEGDGDVEVIFNHYVLDGATGAVQATLAISGSDNWGAPAAADMDGDGVMEIMLENRVYDSTGAYLWACGGGGTGTFPQPVNVDGDSDAELLVAAPGRMTLCDDDGTQLWSRSHTSYGSAVAVADFDGDGEQEFAFANYGQLTLIETDGSTLWATTIQDYSGLAGCTSWDIDLDSVPEVVYADEQDIQVLDGATGMVVLREGSHGSVTLAETPSVADVDGDGQGELLYGSNSGITGITVIGGADGDWPYSPPVYNQYSYYGGNVNEDLSIPAVPEAPWIYEANLFRGQPSAVYVSAAPNLQAEITDVCIAACEPDGFAEVAVQVRNTGGADVADGLPLRLYGRVSGKLQLIDELVLPALPSGSSWEHGISTTPGAMGDALEIVIDEDDAVGECDEDDNRGTWGDLPDCG